MRNLKKFNTQQDWNAYVSGDPIIPNVSLIENNWDVKYMSKMSVSIIFSGTELYAGQEVRIVAITDEDVTGNMLLLISGTRYQVPINNGQAVWVLDNIGAGETPFTVTYAGDAKYKARTKDGVLSILLIPPQLSVEYSCDENVATFTIKGQVDMYGTMSVTVGPYTETGETINGMSVIDVAIASAGTQTALISYGGDVKYASTSITETVHLMMRPTMQVTSQGGPVGTTTTLTVTINSDATGSVYTEYNDNQYSATINAGNAVIEIPGLSAGTYDLYVVYLGDSNYEQQLAFAPQFIIT